MTQPILLFEHPACERHDPGPDHPDTVARLPALRAALAADAALGPLVLRRTAAPAGEDDLRLVHTAAHVERVRAGVEEAARRGAPVWLDEDTAVSAGSWEAALAAAGCAAAAAAAVAGGAPAAFALARPPGHHATAHRAMGFCLFNNAAIAVRRLQAVGAARRVLVVDLDAHHGNGTQDLFYDDPSVFVLSLHLAAPHYPGTGSAAERGAGRGHGTTRNVPLAAGTTAAEYLARFAEALEDGLGSFAPDLVVASVGLDALEGDPEGGLALAPADLHALTAAVLDRLPPAARRFVGVLEGGYALARIGPGFVQVLRALTGLPPCGSQVP